MCLILINQNTNDLFEVGCNLVYVIVFSLLLSMFFHTNTLSVDNDRSNLHLCLLEIYNDLCLLLQKKDLHAGTARPDSMYCITPPGLMLIHAGSVVVYLPSKNCSSACPGVVEAAAARIREAPIAIATATLSALNRE